MRTSTTLLTALLAIVLSAPAFASHGIHGPDGVTARLGFPGSDGDLVLHANAAGDHVVEVSVHRLGLGGWSQVAMWSTLRVFSIDPATGIETDRVLTPFQSSATGAVAVAFPASAIPSGHLADVFVTFSVLGGNPVPTSHHQLAKNAAIDAGQLDLADALDYHGATRLVAS